MQIFFDTWGMWSWMSLGVILMIAELFVPGTFMIWFGFGALLTGLTTLIFGTLGIYTQLFIFVILSLICVTFGIFVYGKIFGPNKDDDRNKKTGAHRYIGQTFTVCETFKNGRGKITVGDSVWIALSNKNFKKGDDVTVTDARGTQLIVE